MAVVVPYVVAAVVSAALSIGLAWLVGPTKTTNYAQKLNRPDIQTSNYGIPIPELHGQARLSGNIIWQPDVKEIAVSSSTSISQGLLKPSSTITNVTYLYTSSLAIGICVGEIKELTRIWADDVLIYDSADVGSPSLAAIGCTLYKGTQTQAVSPLMESVDGVGNNPAYRGLAYITLADFELGKYGNRLPRFMFEVESL